MHHTTSVQHLFEDATHPLNNANDEALAESSFDDLNNKGDFQLQPGDAVWVNSKRDDVTWHRGIVMRGTRTGLVRQGERGLFYLVKYRHNLRRYFTPLLGHIKPDTPRVRRSLRDSGVEVLTDGVQLAML